VQFKRARFVRKIGSGPGLGHLNSLLSMPVKRRI